MIYRALITILRNKVRTRAGDRIELTPEEAKPLLANRAIEPVNDLTPSGPTAPAAAVPQAAPAEVPAEAVARRRGRV